MAQDNQGKELSSHNVNKLNAAQNRKIQDYLLSVWEEIEKKKPSKKEMAARIAGIYDFNVTETNVSSALSAIEKKWPKRTNQGGKPFTGSVSKILAQQLALLVHKLGEEPTKEFKELIDSYRKLN